MCGIWAIFGSEECMSVLCSNCLKIAYRGPDCFRFENIPDHRNCALGFHRLTIVDSVFGMQPLRLRALPHLRLCYNGEIYNSAMSKSEFGFDYETSVDGESVLHLYARGGIRFAAQHLDGVFAACLMDTANQEVHLFRDTFGVRPLFRIITADGTLAVCSEAKGLSSLSLNNDQGVEIEPFLPGHIETYSLLPSGKVVLKTRQQFHEIGVPPLYKTPPAITNGCDEESIYGNIRTLLRAAVRKRFMSERRIGCLLSGGLDSSLVSALVCQIAKDENIEYPIQTFAIGIGDSPDILAARKVAAHIGSEHYEVRFTSEEGMQALRDVVYHSETYDIVTTRSSIALYLLSKYISQKTGSVVIFAGEGADEVAQGYVYFHNAPSAEHGSDESIRLLKDLYLFDVLRADRMTAAHGLEVRVPFLDHQLTSYYLNIPAAMRQPREGVEKFLIRKAFADTGLLPDDILWRPKEAFSDGLASPKKPWFEMLQEHFENHVTDEQLRDASTRFPFNTPPSKEAYYYRQIFEEHFPGKSGWMPRYWWPKWVTTVDPSPKTYDREQ